MGLRESKLLEKIVSVICSSLVPACINIIAAVWIVRQYADEEDPIYIAVLSFIGVFSTIISYIIVYKVLPRVSILRNLSKYEGIWLQLIPDFPERPYSIITFTYNKKEYKYEFFGINFYEDLRSGINFKAHKFVERTFKDGFYYITNSTSEHKNGLGKIAFIKSNYDNFTRAEGYFFDSGSDDCSKKYHTILIKCDKKFYSSLGINHSYMKIKKIPPIEIMRKAKNFADKEIQNYRHNRNTLSSSRSNKKNNHGNIKNQTKQRNSTINKSIIQKKQEYYSKNNKI